MGILLALLFILQIIGFMVMILLYLKITKFNSLEKKQQKLMKEMDQSVLAYLQEIKEENDRLINQLNQRYAPQSETLDKRLPTEETKEKSGTEKPVEPKPIVPSVPVHHALRSYKKTAGTENKEPPINHEKEVRPLDDRERARQLYAEGKSVTDIAREMEKGKTEIELLLKFG